ncbi:MAG TPA: hypothetical protein VGK29_01855 [Paludibaculum sp.]|jgi:hypothetical protein
MSRKKLPPEVLEYFRKEGAKGGNAAAKAMTPEERAARAKKAADAATVARKAKKKTADSK